MSFGPTVLQPRSVPLLSVAFGVTAIVFAVMALLLDQWMGQVAGAVALIAILGALWQFFQARRSSVLIDANQFIIKDGGRQQRFDLSQVETVDLSRLRGHVRFKDGSTVSLPLEGDNLVQAGLMLTPPDLDSPDLDSPDLNG